MSRTESAGNEKHMSLTPQTLYIQNRLAQWTKRGRKHWDLYRWLIDPLILCEATSLVIHNDGAAGLDGLQCSQMKGHEWKFSLELSEKLKTYSYRPGAVRRVYIPKADGKERPLGIPDFQRRVVERALVLLLEPIYEQIFLPVSFGFRPAKSATQCVAEAAHHTYSHRHILEIDIENFFGNVSHKKLLGLLKEQIVDPRILNLIRVSLKAGFVELDKPWQATPVGTTQGSPLSPLLSNIYLHYSLDLKFQQFIRNNPSAQSKFFRFADDFIIMSHTKTELLALKRRVTSWLREAKLPIKKEKTRMADMRNDLKSHSSYFIFLGYKIHLRAFQDNPKRFWVARQPSEKARKALRTRLREKLSPNLSPAQVSQLARSIWKGWSNYFRYGNSNRIFYREVHSVKSAVWRYLRRKYRSQRHPVPWRRLIPLGLWITREIRPTRVIPDSLKQSQGQFNFA